MLLRNYLIINMEIKFVNLNDDFVRHGGAEKIAVQLHKELKKHNFDCYLMGSNSFSENNPVYCIDQEDYVKFRFFLFFKWRNSVVISHHRKKTTLVLILNRIFRLNLKIIHVAQNEFFNLKRFTLLPDNVVAVSNRVKDNLISYFGINPENIRVIYNSAPDYFSEHKSTVEKSKVRSDEVKILYGARITDVKGQVRLVKHLKGKLPSNIKIDFAGVGEEADELKMLVKDDINFRYLGYVDLKDYFLNYHYYMLFSSKEGLPLSIAEACSFKLPVIASDAGGNTEIVENTVNGFIFKSYEDLEHFFNFDIPSPGGSIYLAMAENSRQVYENKFREDLMFRNYFSYIEQVTGIGVLSK